MDDSILKSNFLGRDGFKWWIGQIPPIEAQGEQVNGSGWGNRFKVRIMGYHPFNETELPNNDLPWAQCLIPTTSGSGSANVGTDVKLQPGDIVFGFFLDGDNAQIPVIMGCFGRTTQVINENYQGPFIPFTGYTDKIPEPDKETLPQGQTNESNANSLKSPRHVSPTQARNIGNNEVSYFSGIGDTIQLGSASTATVVDKISCEILNFLKGIQDAIGIFLNIDNEIKRIVKKIQGIISGLVGNVINDLFGQFIPILNEGLNLLYLEIYSLVLSATGSEPAARAAAVAAQQAMVLPVKALQDAIPATINNIINRIGDTIADMIFSLVDNVKRFSSCVGIQFAAAVINDIIGRIVDNLKSPIEGISSILKFFSGFSVDDLIRNSVNAISGIADSLGANQIAPNYQEHIKQWIIGSGPKYIDETPFGEILKNANVSQAIAIIDGVVSAYSIFNSSTQNTNSDCYTGSQRVCNPPEVTIFGSTGTGATAIPIFGSIVEDELGKTASIIGIKITNSGSGYDYPPFVDIRDSCGRGYGAVASTIVNNKGEVTGGYIISTGENYPVGETPPYVIDKIIVQNPGNNYSANDIVIDNNGNVYPIQVSRSGSIINVLSINNTNEVNDLPTFTIKTKTGYGALLKPKLDLKRPYQGDILQSIDCVT